jgi:FAD-dependent urate hydroxylase
MTYTAVIAGGGIAGIASAIALRKAGIDATIYEAYDTTADHVGHFLTLAPNALDALHALDLDVSGLGFDTPGITIHNGSGRRLGYLSNSLNGVPSQTVKRGDLYRFLREQDVQFVYGKRLAQAVSTGGQAQATFTDGSTATADLLIGADGLRSTTRTIIDPAAPTARYTGLLTVGGYVRGVSTGGEPGMMQAIFGKRCFFVSAVSPDGEVWWAANPARADELTPAKLAAITADEWRARLNDLFRRDRGPAAEIIKATGELFTWNSYDVPSLPIWHRDRILVIGDAAHATAPSIGQGAAMALEDAVILAKCLRDSSGVESAFTAYERVRRQRVERVVEQGNRSGGWKALNPLARLPRDLIMSLGMKYTARTGTDTTRWIYDHHIDWNEPVGAQSGRSQMDSR